MKQQNKLLDECEWKNLIILDACRFDYFKQNYKDFLQGELEPVESPVNTQKSFATTNWCKKIFREKDFSDTVYFSSTPRVNSHTNVDGFKASEHFSEIIDLWDQDWDKELGTVLPENVKLSVERRLTISNPNRIIIHFLQPHCPYITAEEPQNVKSNSLEARKSLKSKLMVFFGPKIRKIIGPRKFRKLTDILGFPPVDHLQEIIRKNGEKEVKKLYKENLREALKEVEKLQNSLKGKTVITADHGEYLGELGYYGHSFVPNRDPVKKVPWLEIE